MAVSIGTSHRHNDEQGRLFSTSRVLSVSPTHDPPDLVWYDASKYIMDTVHMIHDVTGIEYAGSIALCTIALRVALFPVAVISRDQKNRKDWVEKELKEFGKEKKIATKEELKATRKLLSEKFNVDSRLALLDPVLGISSLIAMIYSMRNLGLYYHEELSNNGGYLWFADLADPDPLRYLPILSTTIFLLQGEMGADYTGRLTTIKPFWRNFSRGLRIAFFFLIENSSCTIFCYWIPNGLFLIGQTVLLSQPKTLVALNVTLSPDMAQGLTKKPEQPIVMYKDPESEVRMHKSHAKSGKRTKKKTEAKKRKR